MIKLMIIGEAWGKDEESAFQMSGTPQAFVGAAGHILNGVLKSNGINREECYLTNVFNLRPTPTNDVKNLCGSKAEGIVGMPALASGKYVKAIYGKELQRLYHEIDQVNPNLILALGATPAWALLKTTGIKKVRGAATLTAVPLNREYKVLATYHPAAIMRQWKLITTLYADVNKAAREQEFPELVRPRREIWVEPTYDDLLVFENAYIKPSHDLSIDIETIGGNVITCIGFAPTIDRAIVVPFYDPRQPDHNYWRTLEEELKVWEWVKQQCARPVSIVGQNFNYDMHHLLRTHGIPVPHFTDDTMLMHHALQPELEKGLAFLGSAYTDEAGWKWMRPKHTIKRED